MLPLSLIHSFFFHPFILPHCAFLRLNRPNRPHPLKVAIYTNYNLLLLKRLKQPTTVQGTLYPLTKVLGKARLRACFLYPLKSVK